MYSWKQIEVVMVVVVTVLAVIFLSRIESKKSMVLLGILWKQTILPQKGNYVH